MKKHTLEEIIEKANVAHNNFYSYDKLIYKSIDDRGIITCPIHGDFERIIYFHIKCKSGCPDCLTMKKKTYGRDTIESFSKKATKKHKGLYTYDNFIYVDSKTEGFITCSFHGDFEQIPNTHLSGSGCPHCANNRRGYKKSHFIASSKGENSTLYLVRCFKDDEEFYKIGITNYTVKKRFRKCAMPYEYEVLYEFKGEAGLIYDLEKNLFKVFGESKYTPILHFEGRTECFKNIDVDTLEKEIIKINKNN